MVEEWRPVVGYEGVYDVSSLGRVRRVGAARGARVGKILCPRLAPTGYEQINLTRGGRGKTFRLYRLVAEAFLGPPPSADAIVNHVDGIKLNVVADNLEWTDHSGNSLHAVRMGLTPTPPRKVGDDHPQARLSASLVEALRRERQLPRGLRRTVAQMATEYGVSTTAIKKAISGRTWANGQ